MSKKYTFQDYWDALDPANPPSVKERVLRHAYNDPDIDCMEYERLVDRAYAGIFC